MIKTDSLEIANDILIPQIIELLEEGHTVTLKVKGYSMRPFLENNRDKVLLKKAEAVKLGDVVLAEVAPKRYVLHRLIAIDGEQVILRGDGNLSNEYCLKSDIYGMAEGFYRRNSNRLDSCDSRKWKTYSKIWTSLYPIRRYLLGIYRRLIKYKIYTP